MEPIRFEIEQGIELSIEIGEYINQSMLMFKHPTLEEEYELGWDDLGGWHPHVLHWEELEKIVNYLTIQHSDHFVVPFLLLLPFAPISKEEDERTIARRIKAAWRSLQLFKEEEIETFDRQIPYMPDLFGVIRLSEACIMFAIQRKRFIRNAISVEVIFHLKHGKILFVSSMPNVILPLGKKPFRDGIG